MPFPITTTSVEETMDVGARLAKTLDAGAVVALDGDLGAGKTHLVKGLARGLGYDPHTIRSPTFTIVQEHVGGRLPLYHFDAYRVASPGEFVDLGFEEYVYGDGITVIEWPSKVESLIPDDALWLRMEHVSESERRIEKGKR